MEITITEVSAGVYEVVAADASGPRFRTTGTDPQTLIEMARAWVLENGPADLPAHHYLETYRLRLGMAKDGTTHQVFREWNLCKLSFRSWKHWTGTHLSDSKSFAASHASSTRGPDRYSAN
jgi:hypothetical protein